MSKKLRIEVDFVHEQTVYLKTDLEQIPRIVVEIRLPPEGLIRYVVRGGGDESEHYAFELSDEHMGAVFPGIKSSEDEA